MKFKIIFSILILILAITAVYGENTTATFDDLTSSINNDYEIIYLNNTNYISTGDEITIDKNIILDGSYENGTGVSTLDGANLSRIFNIKDSQLVVLKNLNLINGKSDNGGAILFNSNGTLIFCNCNFTNNYAITGGAIYSTGTLDFYDVNFIDSNSKSGSVYSENGDVYLTNSNFNSTFQDGSINVYMNEFTLEINETNLSIEPITPSATANIIFVGTGNYQLLRYNPYTGSIPSKYNLKDNGYLSPILNQGTTGSCWAFATISTLASCILKSTNGGKVLTTNDVLSVANALDVIMDYCNQGVAYNTGGNFNNILPYLTNWFGPTYEQNDKWTGAYHKSTIYESFVHVQNAYNIPIRSSPTDLTKLKKAILDYGAVYTTYHSDKLYYDSEQDFYNPNKNLIANHAVTIVGWDDTYSKYNFKTVNGAYPAGNGAFIVQNSWGSSWGRSGLFYVSYYDGTIYRDTDAAWTFIFNDTLRYNKNYQTEYSGASNYYYQGSTVTGTNTFKILDTDYLVAFSSYFPEIYSYTAKIKVNNVLKLTQTGSNNFPGYCTIELDNFISVKKGDTVTIELTFKPKTGSTAKFSLTSDKTYPIKVFASRYLFESVQNRIDYAKPNSEIFLNAKTYTASSGEKTIIINKSITINGARSDGTGTSTLDANNLIAIMQIAPGCVVNLKNINLMNSKNYGINITSKATVTITNAVFTKNTEAIYLNKDARLTVVYSRFNYNTGKMGNSLYLAGTATITDCTITNSNTGKCEIYVSGSTSLTNNKITTTITPIINDGTITSKTILTFNNASVTVNKSVKLTATVTDDNGNYIVGSKVLMQNMGYMTNEKTSWYLYYTPTKMGHYTLTGSVSGFSSLIVKSGVLISKDYARITAIGGTFNYGSPATVSISLESHESGSLTVYVDNRKVILYNIASSTFKVTLPSLDAGTHAVKIAYDGDEDHLNTNASCTVTILKVKPEITINCENPQYGQPITLSISVTGAGNTELSSKITIDFNGKTYIRYLNAGKCELTISDLLNIKTYTATVTFEETTNYLQNKNQKSITIGKGITIPVVTVSNIGYGDTACAIATLDKKASGTVYFYINNQLSGSSTINNGVAQFNITKLEIGKYNIHAFYNGDSNYKSYKGEATTLTVDKKTTIITTKISTMVYEKTGNINITITPTTNSITGSVSLYIDNNLYEIIYLKNNKATFTFTPKMVGIHKLNIVYNGDKNHKSSTTNIVLNVAKASNNMNYEIINNVHGNTTIKITAPQEEKSNIKFIINKKTYTVKLTKGECILRFGDINAGTYTFQLQYEGTNYANKDIDAEITIISSIKIVTKNITMYYKDGTTLKAVLLDLEDTLEGEVINIFLNNEYYKRTTKLDGSISFNINLSPGDYTARLQYQDTITDVNIHIKETIKGNNVVKYFQNNTHYTVQLLDTTGSELVGYKASFNINGVFYTRTTDNEGKATLQINLGEGTYIITVTNPETQEVHSNTIKVLPTVIAGNVTKYFQNGTQYILTLLDQNGNPIANQKVELNINGVFYTRTSNANGIAIFNINLGPGKFIITANYNGCLISNIITVLSTIESDNLEMENDYRIPFIVTILDDEGIPAYNRSISFNINGIFYNRTTDVNGMAKLNMNLPCGEYIITIMYGKLLTSNTVTIRD